MRLLRVTAATCKTVCASRGGGVVRTRPWSSCVGPAAPRPPAPSPRAPATLLPPAKPLVSPAPRCFRDVVLRLDVPSHSAVHSLRDSSSSCLGGARHSAHTGFRVSARSRALDSGLVEQFPSKCTAPAPAVSTLTQARRWRAGERPLHGQVYAAEIRKYGSRGSRSVSRRRLARTSQCARRPDSDA
jgi:hypothetical protein